MDRRVLVAYATKHGGTAEIAERIGQVLRQAGLSVEVASADRAGDPSGFGAVVLGSAVYVGQWRKEAVRFLKTQESALAGKPLWIFSSGPTGEGDPVQLVQGWRMPGKVQPIVDRLQPRDVAVFHGLLDPKKLNPIERWMIGMVKAPAGDFRDWEAIAAWAQGIAAVLQ